MKRVIRWVMWVITAVVVYKAALWSYDIYRERSRTPTQQEIADIDKLCRMDADTGRCICRHKRTGEHLKLPYEECKSRALNHR
jgi:hypothetical protein